MGNTMAMPVPENVTNLREFKEEKKAKEIHYKADGTVDARFGKKDTDKSGIWTEVYPLTQKEVNQMIDQLKIKIECASTPTNELVARRNLMMFQACINIGLRASDFTQLRWCDWFDKRWNWLDKTKIMPQKTSSKKKMVLVAYNETFKEAVDDYRKELFRLKDRPELTDYVFASKKGGHISVHQVWQLMNDTALACGIEKNIGSHTLRKTFGRFHYLLAEDKQAALVELCKAFNHSSTNVTLKYIGITEDEMVNFYHKVNIGYVENPVNEAENKVKNIILSRNELTEFAHMIADGSNSGMNIDCLVEKYLEKKR